MQVQELLDELVNKINSFDIENAYKAVMSAYYFPVYYAIHAIFICMNLRATATKKGFSWYRSIIVGFLMTTGPRLVLTYLTGKSLTEITSYKAVYWFFGIWLLFNVCPFDIVYKVASLAPFRFIISLLNSFSDSQNIYNVVNTCLLVYDNKFARVFIVAALAMNSTIFVDLIDRVINDGRSEPLAYPAHSIKRITLLVLLLIILGCENVFQDDFSIIPMKYVRISFCGTHVILTFIDLIIYRCQMFLQFDYIFKEYFDIIPYHPEDKDIMLEKYNNHEIKTPIGKISQMFEKKKKDAEPKKEEVKTEEEKENASTATTEVAAE